MMKRAFSFLIAVVLISQTGTDYPYANPLGEPRLAGNPAQPTNVQPANVQPASPKFDVRLGEGTHKGSAYVEGTADVVITVDNNGKTSVKLDPTGDADIAIDARKPVFIGTPTAQPDEPDAPPATSFSKQVTEKVSVINDPVTAQKLVMAYTVIIATANEAESITQLTNTTKQVTSAVYENTQGEWTEFRDFVNTKFIDLEREGKLSSIEDYASALTEVREGIMRSLDNASIILLLPEIMETVQKLLPLIDGQGVTPQKVLKIAMIVLEVFASNRVEVKLTNG